MSKKTVNNEAIQAVPAELDHLFVPAKFKAEEAEKVAYTNYSYWRSTFKVFLSSKTAMFAFILMVVLVVFSFIQPLLPNQQPHSYTFYPEDPNMWKLTPSLKHWFGTDDIGRDYWARVWYASRISLSLAGLIVATETVIGVIVGALWGYFRRIDRFMTEIYNLISNIPGIVLLILLTYILKPGYWTMYIAMSMTGWIGLAKFIRDMTLIIRDREYNLASRCLGTPSSRMITKNLLPHLVSVIIMTVATSIPAIVSNEVTLTFLGIGLPLEIPSLGVLINTGRSVFNFKPHLLAFPAIIVSLITISFYLAGNAFSDASDPRNHM